MFVGSSLAMLPWTGGPVINASWRCYLDAVVVMSGGLGLRRKNRKAEKIRSGQHWVL